MPKIDLVWTLLREGENFPDETWIFGEKVKKRIIRSVFGTADGGGSEAVVLNLFLLAHIVSKSKFGGKPYSRKFKKS